MEYAERNLTYADYAKLPEGAPYQLIGGQLVHEPSPTVKHQSISGNLYDLVRSFVLPRKLGIVLYSPIDVYLEEHETYQPDIVFISNERRAIVAEKRIEGAPDLVVEIISPSTSRYDLGEKRAMYERHGVHEYWIVDPNKESISVLESRDGEFVAIDSAAVEGEVRSRLLEGLTVDLAPVFAPL